MAAYSTRSGLPNTSSGNGNNSRPGSSSKDSTGAIKKPKTKSNKVFQCTGYGDCTMQFTRSEHLARHIRWFISMKLH
jgi:Zinc finger, C2H2 type